MLIYSIPIHMKTLTAQNIRKNIFSTTFKFETIWFTFLSEAPLAHVDVNHAKRKNTDWAIHAEVRQLYHDDDDDLVVNSMSDCRERCCDVLHTIPLPIFISRFVFINAMILIASFVPGTLISQKFTSLLNQSWSFLIPADSRVTFTAKRREWHSL